MVSAQLKKYDRQIGSSPKVGYKWNMFQTAIKEKFLQMVHVRKQTNVP